MLIISQKIPAPIVKHIVDKYSDEIRDQMSLLGMFFIDFQKLTVVVTEIYIREIIQKQYVLTEMQGLCGFNVYPII